MKRIIFMAICVLLSMACKAQLIYQNNHLRFNGEQFDNSYSTTWTGWAHAWVDGSSSNRYLTFVMSNNDPRIGSGSGKIAFYRNGYGYNSIEVSNVYNSSDVTLKSNIKALNNATATVMQLRPVTYTMNRGTSSVPTTLTNNKEYGFVAQEVETVIPDIVIEDDEGLKLVNYTAIIPLLTAVIQEQNERIAILEAKVEEMSK